MNRRSPLFLACVVLLCLMTASTCAAKRCMTITQVVQCGTLSCDESTGECVPCKHDSDCYPGRMYCTGEGQCKVRPLSSGFSVGVTTSMLGATLICAIGVVAGVGGGGLLVPMFDVFMQTPIITSVALSQCTICGQSFFNIMFNVWKKYPVEGTSRPLINYQYLSLLLPLGIVGTLLGGVLNKVCPDWIRLLLLFILLSLVLYRTARKMIKQYRIDQITKINKKKAMEVQIDGPVMSPTSPSAASPVSSAPVEEAPAPAPQLLTVQEQFPKNEIICIILNFAIMLVFNVIRAMATRCGSAGYIVCMIIPLVAVLALFWYSRNRLEKTYKEFGQSQLTFFWNNKTSILFPLVAVIAGAGAAMLGIGGGLVLGFVLYEAGMIPQEASSTSGFATLFLAMEAAVQLLAQGNLVVDYGAIFVLSGVVSAVIGQFCLLPLIKIYGLYFLIIGSLAIIVLGSLVVLMVYGIYSGVVLVQHGGSLMAFGQFCANFEK